MRVTRHELIIPDDFQTRDLRVLSLLAPGDGTIWVGHL